MTSHAERLMQVCLPMLVQLAVEAAEEKFLMQVPGLFPVGHPGQQRIRAVQFKAVLQARDGQPVLGNSDGDSLEALEPGRMCNLRDAHLTD